MATHDDIVKIILKLPLDDEMALMSALLSNDTIRKELIKQPWYLRWVNYRGDYVDIILQLAAYPPTD